MKRVIVFLMLAVCLCGCGSSNAETNSARKSAQSIITLADLQEQNKAGEESNMPGEVKSQKTKATRTKSEIAVNTTEELTVMEEDGIRIQSRIFATIGNELYFCQWAREGREACLYKCEIGSKALKKVDMELADGMDIYDMTSDDAGYLYLLLRDKQTNAEKVTSIIRVLDNEGSIVQNLDISLAMEDSISLHRAFLVDGEGNFYIKGMSSAMYINGDGKLLWEVKDSEIGVNHSFGAASGADGAIYLTYRKDDTSYIGKINSMDGSISEEYPLNEMEAQDQVLALERGTDSDFLLYGNLSGCWAWNKADNTMEARTELSESDLPYDECIVIRGFLEDGRLLLVKNISQGDKLTGRRLEYYPAGK